MKQSELIKYQTIKDRGIGYGGTNHARPHYAFLEKEFNTKKSLVVADLGCGVGKFPMWLKQKYPHHKVYGIDPVFIEEGEKDGVIFLKGDSTNIPLEKVDILTSFDVMEHIHPDDLDVSLKEISRVCNHYITKICTRKSKFKIDDYDLHPIVKDLNWWQGQLIRFFNDVKVVDNSLLWAVNLT